MKAVDSLFRKIIQGPTQFVVPVFQRDYSWTEVHCERLWDDVLHSAKVPSDQLHFIGSVVYIDAEGAASMNKWLLIDGQQRLTTLMLLLIAIRNHIQVSNWEGSSDGPTVRKIENRYLKNADEEGDRRYKLVLRGNDNSHFRALLDDGDLTQGHVYLLVQTDIAVIILVTVEEIKLDSRFWFKGDIICESQASV